MSADLVRRLVRHRELAWALTRRELFQPFAGSAFGVAWALLHPLLAMLVYVLVFSLIFRIRFGDTGGEIPLDYTTYVLAGLVSWQTWATVLSQSCTSVVGSADLVRQADFPSEVLPLRTTLAALVPQLVGLLVVMAYVVVRHGWVPWTWTLLPVALAVQGVAMLGLAYALAALCVFVRDVKEVVGVFVMMGVFLTPAFYTPSTTADLPLMRAVLIVNPFTHFMRVFRDCLFWGRIEHPLSWALAIGLAALGLGLAWRAYQRLAHFFGNFL